jgi:hypothetical protein
LIVTDAVYTCKKNYLSEDNNGIRQKYFTKGLDYRFKLDETEGISETWLVSNDDVGQVHIVASILYEKDEKDEIVDGEWDYRFIDEYFYLKEVLCMGEV